MGRAEPLFVQNHQRPQLTRKERFMKRYGKAQLTKLRPAYGLAELLKGGVVGKLSETLIGESTAMLLTSHGIECFRKATQLPWPSAWVR